MHAAKHAAPDRIRAQEVVDLAVSRVAAEDGAVPVVATAEADAISLFRWDDGPRRWWSTRIPHAPLAVTRGTPSISNTWNWSRRVAATATDGTVVLVYKRADLAEPGAPQPPTRLWLDVFDVPAGRAPQRRLRIPVPMPATFQPGDGPGPGIVVERERPGFELWAGVDEPRRRLLVLTQTLGERANPDGDGATLTLLSCGLDRLDDEQAWGSSTFGPGGYGLDARLHRDELVLVHRTTPAALRVPLPLGGDVGFGGASPVVDASPASDARYAPLRLVRLDLSTSAASTVDLPGGEHPRILGVEPLLVTADRPDLEIRFRPPDADGEPRIDWRLRGMQALAVAIETAVDTDGDGDGDGAVRIARGVLLTHPSEATPSLPRTAAPWVSAQDLYTPVTPRGVGWASTFRRFPLEPLRLTTDDKGLVLDFLHKVPRFALLRSRAHLSVDFAAGTLGVAELRSVVHDVNHAQFGEPAALRPDATGENARFAPFQLVGQVDPGPVRPPRYRCDNTIGGALVTDRDGEPSRFQAYVDLGDGGLRVLFDDELGPPEQPPAVDTGKSLPPAAVPGPGSGGERWVELRAADYQDAGVPAIVLDNLFIERTVTSAVHAQVEALVQAAFSLTGRTPDPENGFTDGDVNAVQTALNELAAGFGDRVDDGAAPRAFIEIPDPLVADAESEWVAGVENEQPVAVAWRFTRTLPIGPLSVAAEGTAATVALPVRGDWAVRAEITRADGSVRVVETVAAVGESLFRRISGVHRRLANRSVGPPLNAVGGIGLGTSTLRLLQYALTFPVEPDTLTTRRIVVETLAGTDAQWRFRSVGPEQGVIDYRLRIGFETSDVRLSGLLGALARVERISASFRYGRPFTPGVLMNDTRAVTPTTGAPNSRDNLREDQSRLASAVTAQPIGDADVTADKADITASVSMLAQAVAAGVVTLLLGLGAGAAATALLFLIGAAGVSAAAAAVPVAGAVAAAAAVAAALAVAVFVAVQVPRIVEARIVDDVYAALTGEATIEGLEEARLLQFAGEGAAEALARATVAALVADGVALGSTEVDGGERFRQDLVHMIHVGEGFCRVLVRA